MIKPIRFQSERCVEIVSPSDGGYWLYPSLEGELAERPSYFVRTEEYQSLVGKSPGSVFESRYLSGEYNPRIWKGIESPTPGEMNLVSVWLSSVRASRVLFSRLRDIFKYIEPAQGHESVYGYELRDLLILACTEVESSWRSVLKANGMNKDKFDTRDYVKLCIPMRLNEWAVRLSGYPEYGVFTPFDGWDDSRPTQSLPWYDAYNATKHGRESSFSRATLHHTISAMAAVFLMNIAQFGESHLDQNQFFSSDEFAIVLRPRWTPEESYIRPIKLRDKADAWLGYKYWKASAFNFNLSPREFTEPVDA